MKALRWHGRRDVRLEDVEGAPAPQAGEVRIDVEWCGICGTDLEEYSDGPVVISTEPHPLTGHQAPMIIGHEIAGRVADVGEGVTGLKVGQLVAVDGMLSCGTCRECRVHQTTRCKLWACIGMGFPGGLAEQVTVPAHIALGAPDGTDVGADELALAEPMSVAVRAIRRSRLSLGERVVVLGGGTIGLAVLQVARASGASDVVVVDPLPFRQEMATKLGARAGIAPGDGVADAVVDAEGYGPDIVFDCTGIATAPQTALDLVRSGGRIVMVSLPTEPGMFDHQQLTLREVELIGSLSHVYDEDFATAVHLIATKRVDAASLITHRLPIEKAVDEGIAFLAGPDRGRALKILISPRS